MWGRFMERRDHRPRLPRNKPEDTRAGGRFPSRGRRELPGKPAARPSLRLAQGVARSSLTRWSSRAISDSVNLIFST